MPKLIKDAKRTAIYGASGMGKSTLLKELLRGSHPRVLIYDLMDEYGAQGAKVVRSHDELVAALRAGWHGNFAIAYVPPPVSYVRDLHTVSTLLMMVQRPYYDAGDQLNVDPLPLKITFVVEELSKSFPNQKLPDNLRNFSELCLRGRHYGIALFGTTQRPALVSPDFRGNAMASYWFPLEFDEDVQVAVKQMKLADPNVEQRVRGLTEHHYLKYENRQVRAGANRLK